MLLITCGAVAKKLVRGSGWRRTDFFLGVELSLAAMALALVYMLDLSRLTLLPSTSITSVSQKIAATALFLALSFFLLLWVVSTHQDWEKKSRNPNGQLFWLGIISNLVGTALLIAFITIVKGV